MILIMPKNLYNVVQLAAPYKCLKTTVYAGVELWNTFLHIHSLYKRIYIYMVYIFKSLIKHIFLFHSSTILKKHTETCINTNVFEWNTLFLTVPQEPQKGGNKCN